MASSCVLLLLLLLVVHARSVLVINALPDDTSYSIWFRYGTNFSAPMTEVSSGLSFGDVAYFYLNATGWGQFEVHVC